MGVPPHPRRVDNPKLQMREVLSHPLGPLHWALFTADGLLRKTNKGALAKELEKRVPFADVIPLPSICMKDAMENYFCIQRITRPSRVCGRGVGRFFS